MQERRPRGPAFGVFASARDRDWSADESPSIIGAPTFAMGIKTAADAFLISEEIRTNDQITKLKTAQGDLEIRMKQAKLQEPYSRAPLRSPVTQDDCKPASWYHNCYQLRHDAAEVIRKHGTAEKQDLEEVQMHMWLLSLSVLVHVHL